MKVLVAEDDAHIREGLIDILDDEGYETIEAEDGISALSAFEEHKPDFVCLDIMMPNMSGYDVCREIRKKDGEVPLIFISAKSEEIDRVIGLELGADDFIMKPFGVKEVIARIRAVSRRCMAQKRRSDSDDSEQRFTIGDLEVLPRELRARRNDKVVELSLRDVKLLKLFHQHPSEVLSRDQIFDACWGMKYMPSSRTLDQHISQLRKRIEVDAKNPQIIRTVHGAGYRYEPS